MSAWTRVAIIAFVSACSEAPDARVSFPPPADRPLWLSSIGLYSAPDLLEFTPSFPLWTDGATKRRWLRLPQGSQIDTSDPDHWQFPPGTVLFKEFSISGHRIETRVIARTGNGPRDYWMGAFAWNDDESDARFVPAGVRNARGTTHDIPSSTQCATCHNSEPGRVLGFSAVQQPRVDAALLTTPMQRSYAPPGDGITAAALGYLHANCGHCHNPNGSARPDTDMNLRLSITDRAAAETQTARTTIGRSLQSFTHRDLRVRVAPGEPERSGVFFRMRENASSMRMPPLGTARIDERGVGIVKAWIDHIAVSVGVLTP
jgi:hypothetical protein